MENFDSDSFKSRDASSYDSLIEQFDIFTNRLSRPLAVRLLSLAEIDRSAIILDVGTGTGIVALEAAQAADFEGTVYGIDLSRKMLVKAGEKAKQMGISQKAYFSRMDAEHLAFEDQKFDTVVSLFALLHFPDPLTALKEIYRVTKPGGRVVIGVGSGIPLYSLSGWFHLIKRFPELFLNLQGKRLVAPNFLNSLVEKHIKKMDEPEESGLASHSHNRTRTVPALMKEAGFKVLKTAWQGHQETINTPQEFWEIQSIFSSIARKRLSLAAPNEIESLYQIFLEKCRKVQMRGGCLVYPFAAFYVAAERLKK